MGLPHHCSSIAAATTATAARRSPPLPHLSRRTICAVCRLWRRLFYEQPAVWRRLAVRLPQLEQQTVQSAAAQRFTAKLAVLQRVAPLVEEAVIEGSSFNVLGLLAGQADGLAAFLTALQRATRLSSLTLDQPVLAAAAGAALAALASLATLRRAGGFGPHDASALPALRQLRELSVQSDSLHGFPPCVPHLPPLLTSL